MSNIQYPTGSASFYRTGDIIVLRTVGGVSNLTLDQAECLSRAMLREIGTQNVENPLSPRETEVLRGIGFGLSNKETARKLNVSTRTVETHRLNLRYKTRTGLRSDLFHLATSLGLEPL